MNVRLLLFLYFVALLNGLHSQNLCRKAGTTSISTTFVGTAIPTKLLGTVHFDKSCVLSGSILRWGEIQTVARLGTL